MGSNFEEARGFVRKNWKSKNFNPDNNPLIEDSSSDDEEYGEEYDEIEEDQEAVTINQKKQKRDNDFE